MSVTIPLLSLALLASTGSDPYRLTRSSKIKHVKMIVEYAETNNHDAYELLAIAITESSLNPRAYSHTKDSGLFQVNCRWWYKHFKYKTIKECEAAMFDPDVNIQKAIYILNSFRGKYKQCRKNYAYRCYNGGQGWPRSKNKNKILNYGKKVEERKRVLHKYYKGMIENIRSSIKTRS